MKNIFVSSTFRDMQAERDMVQREVTPYLRKAAREYGENINLIDLRWGVDTTELAPLESSMKVMTVCLDEVEKSHPYMLIFLGERYGCIIDPSCTEKVISKKGVDLGLDDYAISITAMEVEFGALSEKFGDLRNCVVCFRDNVSDQINNDDTKSIYAVETEELKKKQSAFKQKIYERVNGRVINYTCSWDEGKNYFVNFVTDTGESLSKAIADEFCNIFKQEWMIYSQLSWQEKEAKATDALMEHKLRAFRGRTAFLAECFKHIVDNEGITILTGKPGSGKSSIMFKLIDMLETEGRSVFRFVSGQSVMSETSINLVRQLTYFIENKVGINHCSDEDLKRSSNNPVEKSGDNEVSLYDMWLKRLTEVSEGLEERIYVAIDALDQMQSDEHLEKLDFVISNPNIVYFCSCIEEYKLPAFSIKNMLVKEVPSLSKSDVIDISKGLFDASSRNAYSQLLGEIEMKSGTDNPLYVSMIIQRLNMMGLEELFSAKTEEEIVRKGISIIREFPSGLYGAAVAVIDDAITDIGKGSLNGIVEMIALTKHGLRESDLIALSLSSENSVSALDISRLINYLDGFFVIHADGSVDFSHKAISEAVCEKITSEKREQMYSDMLERYFESLPDDDVILQKEGMHFAVKTRSSRQIERILLLAHGEEEIVVRNAVKEELLRDTGDYVSEEIANLSGASTFFLDDINNLLAESKDEMTTKVKILSAFIRYMEAQYENNQSLQYLIDLGTSYLNMGQAVETQGDLNESLEYYKKGTETREKIYEIDKSQLNLTNLASCYEYVTGILLCQLLLEEATEYCEKALTLRKTAYSNAFDSETFAHVSFCYSLKENILKLQKKYDEALVICKEAERISRQFYEKDKTLKNLYFLNSRREQVASVLLSQGKIEEALEIYKEVLSQREETYEETSSIEELDDLRTSYYHIGGLLVDNETPEEAFDYYKKALETSLQLHEKYQDLHSYRDLGYSYREFGSLLRELELPNKAAEYYEKALQVRKNVYEKTQSILDLGELCGAYESVGHAFMDQEEYETAYTFFLNAYDNRKLIYEQSPNPKTLYMLAFTCVFVGDSLCNNDETKRALEYYMQALEICDQIRNDSPTYEGAEMLGDIEFRIGDALFDIDAESALDLYAKDIKRYESRIRNLLNNTDGSVGSNLSLICEWMTEYNDRVRELNVHKHKTEAFAYAQIGIELAQKIYDCYGCSIETLENLKFSNNNLGDAHTEINQSVQYYNRAREFGKKIRELQE